MSTATMAESLSRIGTQSTSSRPQSNRITPVSFYYPPGGAERYSTRFVLFTLQLITFTSVTLHWIWFDHSKWILSQVILHFILMIRFRQRSGGFSNEFLDEIRIWLSWKSYSGVFLLQIFSFKNSSFWQFDKSLKIASNPLMLRILWSNTNQDIWKC